MLTDLTADQKKMKESLTAAYNLRSKRKDAFLFIQSCPRSEWAFLLDELEKISLDKWTMDMESNSQPIVADLKISHPQRRV